MKTLTLFLCFFSNYSFSQSDMHKQSRYPLLNYGYYDYSSTKKSFNDKILQQTFTDKVGRIAAQTFRYNDSAYILEQYDTLGRVTGRGMILLCSENLDSVRLEIPNYLEDPTGTLGLFRDTLVINLEYGKQGIWMEREAGNTLWHGNYFHNKKEGIWKRSLEVDHTKFPAVDTIVFYRRDLTIEWEPPAAKTSMFAMLKGHWYTNPVLSSKRYLFIQKDNDLKVKESDFNFSTLENMNRLQVVDIVFPESSEYQNVQLSLVKRTNGWWLYAGDKLAYRIFYCTPNQIILQN